MQLCPAMAAAVQMMQLAHAMELVMQLAPAMAQVMQLAPAMGAGVQVMELAPAMSAAVQVMQVVPVMGAAAMRTLPKGHYHQELHFLPNFDQYEHPYRVDCSS